MRLGDSDGPGTLTVVIYSDGGDTPGVELFSSSWTVTTAHSGPFIWETLTGLNWNLPAGTYWIAGEVRPGQTYIARWQGSGFQGSTPPPSPLVNEAYNVEGSAYIEFDDLDLGVRICMV